MWTWVRIIGYAVIPMVMAWAGLHLAAEAMTSERNKVMFRALFVSLAVVAILMVALVEAKDEQDHEKDRITHEGEVKEQKAAIEGLNKKLQDSDTARQVDEAQNKQKLNDIAKLVNGYKGDKQDLVDSVARMIGTKSPDPYFGIPSATVVMWAQQEADELENLGNKCEQDYIVAKKRSQKNILPDPKNGFYGTDYIQTHFWSEYNAHHEETITKLHDSLTFRLGPLAIKAEEDEYQRLLRAQGMPVQDVQKRGWELCMATQEYSRDLRTMAMKLSH